MLENRLKRRVVAGERLYGAWIGLGSENVVELLGTAGYDFLVVDQEHSVAALADPVPLMRAADAAGCPTIVRAPWNDQVYLKRILDAGALSVMIPMIENRAEAEAAVAACRYPPAGRRGYAAPAMRCSKFGFIKDYCQKANDELFIIAQIESANAAEIAADIASVDGVDMVLIGVNDMAGTIGMLEQLDRPEVDALVRRCEAGVRKAGKPLGTVPSARKGTLDLFKDGYQLVTGAGDGPLLREAAIRDLATIRAGMS